MENILKKQFFWYVMMLLFYLVLNCFVILPSITSTIPTLIYFDAIAAFQTPTNSFMVISILSVIWYIGLHVFIKNMKIHGLEFSLLKLFAYITVLDCVLMSVSLLYIIPMGIMFGIMPLSLLAYLLPMGLAIAMHLFPIAVGALFYELGCFLFRVKK